jgi:hypothetical protein
LSSQRYFLPLLLALLVACPSNPGDKASETDEPDDTDVVDTERPEDAWGPAQAEPLLEGATLVTEDELAQLGGTTFSVTPEQKEAGRLAEDAKLAVEEADVRSWLSDRGLEQDVLTRMLDEEPDATTDLTEQFDGTYQLIVRDPESQQEITRVITMGRRELVSGLKRVTERVDDPNNHVDIYKDLYVDVPEILLDQIPTPTEVDTFAEDDRLEINQYLVDILDRITFALPDPGGTPPQARPSTCENETGAGANTDRAGGAEDLSSFSSQGIYDNYVWPLKWYATCVKDQANRGTCGSFGISAAMETAVALRDNEWVNLSEQDLYFRLRGAWNPSSYGDGLNTHASWQDMLSREYTQPFEDRWPYNPSWSRMANDTTATYSNSCNGYQFPNPAGPLIPNYCSDTVHQGGSYCLNLGLWQVCGWFSPVPDDNTVGYKPSSEAELWDPSKKDFSLALTQLALAIKRPVVLWAFVTPSFDAATTDGFVSYVGSGESNRGSHIYQVTGFITNEALSGVLPNAPMGSGGGYLIAKNSWGDVWADAGYVYLPFDWVKDYTISMTILHGLE